MRHSFSQFKLLGLIVDGSLTKNKLSFQGWYSFKDWGKNFSLDFPSQRYPSILALWPFFFLFVNWLSCILVHLSDQCSVVLLLYMAFPSENGRVLQVLRRGLKENGKNFDYFGNKSTLEASEPLVATVILYLSNVDRGGQILFPKSEVRGKFCTSLA